MISLPREQSGNICHDAAPYFMDVSGRTGAMPGCGVRRSSLLSSGVTWMPGGKSGCKEMPGYIRVSRQLNAVIQPYSILGARWSWCNNEIRGIKLLTAIKANDEFQPRHCSSVASEILPLSLSPYGQF